MGDSDGEDEPDEKEAKKEHKEKKEKKEPKEKKAKKSKDSDEDDDAEEETKEKKESEVLEYGDKDVGTLVNTMRDFHQNNPSLDAFYDEMRMHQLADAFDHKLRLYMTLEVVCGD